MFGNFPNDKTILIILTDIKRNKIRDSEIFLPSEGYAIEKYYKCINI